MLVFSAIPLVWGHGGAGSLALRFKSSSVTLSFKDGGVSLNEQGSRYIYSQLCSLALHAVSSAWIRRTGTGVEVVLCKSEMSEEEDIAAVMGFSGFGKTCKGRSELHVILRWQ